MGLKYYRKYMPVIIAITVPAFLFIMLAEEVIRKKLAAFDSTIYDCISGYISPNMTAVMKAISYAGSAQVLIAIAVLSIFFLRKRGKYFLYSKLICANLTLTWLLNTLFKALFQRERPDILRLAEASGYSFPSGHSMTSLSFYGLIIYLCIKLIRNPTRRFISVVFLSGLILAIGMSRVYLGVHYASDVLAGFSAGLAWLALFITLSGRYYNTLFEHSDK
jgi:undecaprenyl-diphosphatase